MIKTTHIGSLPFTDIDQAFEFDSQFSLPCLFSLPLINENDFMLAQVLGDKDGVEFDQSLYEKKIEIPLKKAFLNKGFEKFKFQIVGPVTLMRSIKNFPKEDTLKFLDWYLSQVKYIFAKADKEKCYLFIDEPMLFMADKTEYILLNSFLECLKGEFDKLALHCCSEFKLELIEQHLLDGLSFESKYLKSLTLRKSIDIFLGVLNPKTLTLDPNINLSEFNNDIYLTPHCGLALSDETKLSLVHNRLIEWANMTTSS